jgi:hypothetical protein
MSSYPLYTCSKYIHYLLNGENCQLKNLIPTEVYIHIHIRVMVMVHIIIGICFLRINASDLIQIKYLTTSSRSTELSQFPQGRLNSWLKEESIKVLKFSNPPLVPIYDWIHYFEISHDLSCLNDLKKCSYEII